VTIAACLLLYSLALLVGGPPILRRLTSLGHTPLLGVAAWLTAMASVLVSWVVATTSAIVDVAHHRVHPGAAIAACLTTLRGLAAGNAGTALQIGLFAVISVGAAAIAASAWRLLRTLVRMRSRTYRHARAVHVVGRRVDGLDAVVIDSAEPAAYCVPGRPHAVVVTSAALAALSERELAAILAHERAHIRGRHPQIVAVVRGLAATFPKLSLMAQGAQHISRLLEMHADDAAAEQHGRASLLGGLLALTGSMPVTSGALGATGVAVLARAERLAAVTDVRPGRTALTAAAIAFAAGGPLATIVLAVAGVLSCGF